MPKKYNTEAERKEGRRLALKKYDDSHKIERSEYCKNRYPKIRDKMLAYGREYEQRPDRKAIRKEQKKIYYKENKDRIYEYREKYYLENPKKKEQSKEKSKEYKAAHPEVTKKAFDKYNKTQKAKDRFLRYEKNHPNRGREKSAKQRIEKKNRMPLWADRSKIKEFYKNCPKGMVIDHIIPLQGKLVSGLHVHTNLQYLTQKENSVKLNKFSFDDYKETDHYKQWLNSLNEAIEKFSKE